MERNERERIWTKTGEIFLLLLVKLVLITTIGLLVFANQGCDKPYLPWNAGARWPSSEQPRRHVRTERVPQRPIENFCEDNRQSVENYRHYLEPGYEWNAPPDVVERRKRYLRQFIEQYEQRCDSE